MVSAEQDCALGMDGNFSQQVYRQGWSGLGWEVQEASCQEPVWQTWQGSLCMGLLGRGMDQCCRKESSAMAAVQDKVVELMCLCVKCRLLVESDVQFGIIKGCWCRYLHQLWWNESCRGWQLARWWVAWSSIGTCVGLWILGQEWKQNIFQSCQRVIGIFGGHMRPPCNIQITTPCH